MHKRNVHVIMYPRVGAKKQLFSTTVQNYICLCFIKRQFCISALLSFKLRIIHKILNQVYFSFGVILTSSYARLSRNVLFERECRKDKNRNLGFPYQCWMSIPFLPLWKLN